VPLRSLTNSSLTDCTPDFAGQDPGQMTNVTPDG
jgi:hypothetical protein